MWCCPLRRSASEGARASSPPPELPPPSEFAGPAAVAEPAPFAGSYYLEPKVTTASAGGSPRRAAFSHRRCRVYQGSKAGEHLSMDEKFELLLEERTQERSEPRTVSGLGEMGEVGVELGQQPAGAEAWALLRPSGS